MDCFPIANHKYRNSTRNKRYPYNYLRRLDIQEITAIVGGNFGVDIISYRRNVYCDFSVKYAAVRRHGAGVCCYRRSTRVLIEIYFIPLIIGVFIDHGSFLVQLNIIFDILQHV